MGIQLISVSYQYAPLQVREKFSFSKEKQDRILKSLVMREEIMESVLVSTCNRTELYCYGSEQESAGKVFAVMQQELLLAAGFESQPDVSSYLRFYQGGKASHHLFQVAAGLDSMVIGEDQILGQIKDAHEQAMQIGTTGVYLNTLFRYAVTGAKKVKTETELSKTPVSIASLAVKSAVQCLGNLSGKNVMVIGASGKTGSIVFKNLACISGVNLYATARRDNIHCPNIDFTQISYADRYKYLDRMDVIISATSSPHYTITGHKFAEYAKTQKQRVLIDLAVPMDLEKSIKEMDQVIFYNIDDFERISIANNEKKKKEIKSADFILDEYENKFEQWHIFKYNTDTIETICDFMEKESREKDVKHAVMKLFYQVRDSASPEELEFFFQSLKERNEQWED